MKIYHIQATEEEMESIHAIMDAFRGNLGKNSVYQQDIKNVKRFLTYNDNFFNTSDLLHLCHELIERNELSVDGFRAIRKIVKMANAYTDNDQPLDEVVI